MYSISHSEPGVNSARCPKCGRDHTASYRKCDRCRLVRRAGRAVKAATERGALARPTRCEGCGVPGPLDAAHVDYEPPYLNVRFLCRLCHVRFDRAHTVALGYSRAAKAMPK
jgi:hypothetical protein